MNATSFITKSGINKSAFNENYIKWIINLTIHEEKMSAGFIKKKKYPKKIDGEFFTTNSASE
ncbi:hypothetical protein BN2475_190236 [Paraburkholderia ribeironis]|uniref:Uncharacterized protein n=1 Tax=Paraburkholderia ribeironis TaxID=1247936 RepID=A0A1N7RWA4_9BURK|nr:hypothetical protein BN2475_190236 [Paraburkholderia ribeironis]